MIAKGTAKSIHSVAPEPASGDKPNNLSMKSMKLCSRNFHLHAQVTERISFLFSGCCQAGASIGGAAERSSAHTPNSRCGPTGFIVD
jgi:hypothetical protein